MKKKTALVLLPISAMMLLAGCGGEKEEKPVDAGTIRDEVVHITLKTSGGNDHVTLLNRYAQTFKEIEPNIRVKIDKVGGGYKGIASKTVEELNTGLHGDMVIMYPDAIASCMNTRFVYDLTPYIDNADYGLSARDKRDYFSSYLEEGKKYAIPGIYSLPFSKSTEVMFYNEEVLIDTTIPGANGGNKLDHNYFKNMTWETLFEEFCPAVIEYMKTPEGKNFIDTSDKTNGWSVVGFDSDANLFITLAEQLGAGYTSVDQTTGKGKYEWNNDTMKAVMKKLAEYKSKNYICTQNTLTNKVRPNNLFTKNQCLLSIGSTGGVKYQISDTEPYTVIPCKLPHPEGKEAKVISQGPSIGFLRHKKQDGSWDKNRQLASWLFYKHITSTANNIDWAINAKYLPIRKSVAESAQYQKFADPTQFTERNTLAALFARTNKLTATEYTSETFFTSPAFNGSSKCRDNIDILVGDCLKSNGTDAAIKKIFDDTMNEITK